MAVSNKARGGKLTIPVVIQIKNAIDVLDSGKPESVLSRDVVERAIESAEHWIEFYLVDGVLVLKDDLTDEQQLWTAVKFDLRRTTLNEVYDEDDLISVALEIASLLRELFDMALGAYNGDLNYYTYMTGRYAVLHRLIEPGRVDDVELIEYLYLNCSDKNEDDRRYLIYASGVPENNVVETAETRKHREQFTVFVKRTHLDWPK